MTTTICNSNDMPALARAGRVVDLGKGSVFLLRVAGIWNPNHAKRRSGCNSVRTILPGLIISTIGMALSQLLLVFGYYNGSFYTNGHVWYWPIIIEAAVMFGMLSTHRMCLPISPSGPQLLLQAGSDFAFNSELPRARERLSMTNKNILNLSRICSQLESKQVRNVGKIHFFGSCGAILIHFFVAFANNLSRPGQYPFGYLLAASLCVALAFAPFIVSMATFLCVFPLVSARWDILRSWTTKLFEETFASIQIPTYANMLNLDVILRRRTQLSDEIILISRSLRLIYVPLLFGGGILVLCLVRLGIQKDELLYYVSAAAIAGLILLFLGACAYVSRSSELFDQELIDARLRIPCEGHKNIRAAILAIRNDLDSVLSTCRSSPVAFSVLGLRITPGLVGAIMYTAISSLSVAILPDLLHS